MTILSTRFRCRACGSRVSMQRHAVHKEVVTKWILYCESSSCENALGSWSVGEGDVPLWCRDPEKEITVYDKLINRFGPTSQILKTAEELSELTAEIIKYSRNDSRGGTETIVEEIVDVMIMLRQLCIVFKIENLEELIEKKLKDVVIKYDL